MRPVATDRLAFQVAACASQTINFLALGNAALHALRHHFAGMNRSLAIGLFELLLIHPVFWHHAKTGHFRVVAIIETARLASYAILIHRFTLNHPLPALAHIRRIFGQVAVGVSQRMAVLAIVAIQFSECLILVALGLIQQTLGGRLLLAVSKMLFGHPRLVALGLCVHLQIQAVLISTTGFAALFDQISATLQILPTDRMLIPLWGLLEKIQGLGQLLVIECFVFQIPRINAGIPSAITAFLLSIGGHRNRSFGLGVVALMPERANIFTLGVGVA